MIRDEDDISEAKYLDMSGFTVTMVEDEERAKRWRRYRSANARRRYRSKSEQKKRCRKCRSRRSVSDFETFTSHNGKTYTRGVCRPCNNQTRERSRRR